MPKPEVLISLVSDKISENRDFSEKITEVLWNFDGKISPQFMNYFEPIDVIVKNKEDFVDFWTKCTGSILARRSHSVKNEFYASFNGPHHMGRISIRFQWNARLDWLSLFRALAENADAEFGYLHVFRDPEARGGVMGSPHYSFWIGVASVYLKEHYGIPNLGWATWFGGKYSDVPDVEKLKDQGYWVEDLKGGKLLQITEKFSDVIRDFPMFSARRAQARACFPNKFLHVTLEPGDAGYEELRLKPINY